MKVNVNVIVDFSFGFLTHDVLGMVPPAPAPVPVPMQFSIEMVALFMWTLGFLMNQNKFSNGAKPVTHKGMWIALDGHDSGMMIPDMTIGAVVPPIANLKYPLMWTFSSRKPILAASTVKMNGTAVACAQWIGLPPLPMMTCGEPVSLPVCWSAISVTNTLQVGMTFLDLIIGVINVAASVATDLIFAKLDLKPTGLSDVGQAVLGNALKGLSPVSSLAGLLTSSLTGSPTYAASFGLPFAGVSISYTPDPAPGSSSVVGGLTLPGLRGDTDGNGQVVGVPVTL